MAELSAAMENIIKPYQNKDSTHTVNTGPTIIFKIQSGS